MGGRGDPLRGIPSLKGPLMALLGRRGCPRSPEHRSGVFGGCVGASGPAPLLLC